MNDVQSHLHGPTHTNANKYSSVGHHDQKNKKTNSQIKFLAITIRQQIFSFSLTTFST